MSYFDLNRLNKGLTRVASVKTYPTVRHQFIARRSPGRVFRVGTLHSKALTDEALLRNRRGYINAQINTVAHAPSLYHWLFHRCGIPFAETQVLVQNGALKVDDVVVTRLEDLESQLEWSTFQELNIQVRSTLPSLQPSVTRSSTEAQTASSSASLETHAQVAEALQQGPWVPALKRALHRSYYFMFVHPGVSISSDEADPKSFVHRLSPLLAAPSAALGLNVIHPIGLINGMRGLGIASNDVAMLRYWNNEFMGNYGVYDVRFRRGTPSEVVRRVAEDMGRTVSQNVRPQLSRCVTVPCSCTVERLPTASRDAAAVALPTFAMHEERLLVSTPLMPFRVVQRVRRVGGTFILTRSGPFVLNPALVQQKMRPLSPSELALLFTFERRLKVNRLIMSLREFDEDGDVDERTR